MKRLRVALSKGRLLEPTLAVFGRAGFPVPDGRDLQSRRLVFRDGEIEWILVKDGDVVVYVEHGAADLGVVGLDQILESEPDVASCLSLPFGRCRMMLISRPDEPPINTVSNPVVATKYPRLTERWLSAKGVTAEIARLSGSIELAAVLGLAPYIVDLVETGTTIRVNGLREMESVSGIEPRLIANRHAMRVEPETVRTFVERVRSGIENSGVEELAS